VKDLVKINADGLCYRICGSQKKSEKKLIHGIELARKELLVSLPEGATSSTARPRLGRSFPHSLADPLDLAALFLLG
jgi:hypothetical protein